MKTFRAQVEERYVWDCPYCGEINEDLYEDPADQDFVYCEGCGKEAKCEGTDR
jgi:peptide subunit release factor 1 (eRF1)